MIRKAQYQAIVLTDGHCNLCNRSVRYLVRHDPEGRLRFAAQQEPPGPGLLRRAGLPDTLQPGIVVLDAEGRNPVIGAAAIRRITAVLRPRARFLRAVAALPGPIIKMGYGLIARNRIRFFGRQTICAVDPGQGFADRLFTVPDFLALP